MRCKFESASSHNVQYCGLEHHQPPPCERLGRNVSICGGIISVVSATPFLICNSGYTSKQFPICEANREFLSALVSQNKGAGLWRSNWKSSSWLVLFSYTFKAQCAWTSNPNLVSPSCHHPNNQTQERIPNSPTRLSVLQTSNLLVFSIRASKITGVVRFPTPVQSPTEVFRPVQQILIQYSSCFRLEKNKYTLSPEPLRRQLFILALRKGTAVRLRRSSTLRAVSICVSLRRYSREVFR
jgi:hypothetical protein